MELVSQPQDWLPVYNRRGEFVFADSINEAQTFYPVFSIGPPNTTFQATYQLSETNLVLVAGGPYGTDPNATWPGGFLQVVGTQNYDGIYRIERLLFGFAWVLQGEATFPLETTGQFRTHFANMRLFSVLDIENTYTRKFRVDASSDGQYRANVHDYLKDYFRFQVSQVPQGRFNLLSTSIRYAFSYAAEYDRVNRVWDGSQWIYPLTRVLENLIPFGALISVNAALQYKEAYNLANLQGYVVGPASNTNTPFSTYRPRNTYVGINEDLFVTTLRSQASHTPQGLVVAYASDGTALQSIAVNVNDPSGYERPHHTLWNIGTAALTLPTNTAYYTFEVRVGGVQRSERMTVRIKDKCGAVQVLWKNEFGAPEVVSFYGINEESIGVNYATAGNSPYLDSANRSTYSKRSSQSPSRVTLNTGLIDTAHAKWLLGMARNTEVFVKLNDKWHPLIITPQQIGPISSYSKTHNLTFACDIPFEVAQIGNITQ